MEVAFFVTISLWTIYRSVVDGDFYFVDREAEI
jgi:hypothetical protein